MSLSKFTSTPPGVQRFSIPETIVHYILKHPTSHRLWKKLIQTCKHFFSKNPILVVDSLWHKYGDTLSWTISLNDEIVPIEIEECPCKLWITSIFTAVLDDVPQLVSVTLPKVYRCELTELRLQGMTLSYEEFQFLTSSHTIETLKTANLILQHYHGRMVDIDEVLQLVPRAKSVCM